MIYDSTRMYVDHIFDFKLRNRKQNGKKAYDTYVHSSSFIRSYNFCTDQNNTPLAIYLTLSRVSSCSTNAHWMRFLSTSFYGKCSICTTTLSWFTQLASLNKFQLIIFFSNGISIHRLPSTLLHRIQWT